MWLVAARLILRYGAGALVTYGVITEDMGQSVSLDPDLAMALGAAIAAAVEGFYAVAKKKGWRT